MDEQERKILYFLLVGAVTLALFLFLLIRHMIMHHLHSQRLYRLMNSLEVKTLEGERRRLSADLHDEIAPKVAITRMLVSNIQVRPKDRAFAEKVLLNNDEVIARLKEISLALAPLSLLREGLVNALIKLTEDLNLGGGINWSFEHEGYKRQLMDEEAEMHCYRIMQEASYNVLKYSKANHAQMRLAVQRRFAELSICDDGIGLQQSKRDSTGLNNMAIRAELMKGKLFVNSKPNAGTQIVVQIPLKS